MYVYVWHNIRFPYFIAKNHHVCRIASKSRSSFSLKPWMFNLIELQLLETLALHVPISRFWTWPRFCSTLVPSSLPKHSYCGTIGNFRIYYAILESVEILEYIFFGSNQIVKKVTQLIEWLLLQTKLYDTQKTWS